MVKKAGRLGTVVLAVLPLIALAWLVFFDTEVGMAHDVGMQYSGSPPRDFSSVPETVIESAKKFAAEVKGTSQSKVQDLVNQFLAAYMEVKNSDFVIIFNPGGWGWNYQQKTTGWGSILAGIQSQLESQGYQAQVMNYRRTSGGITGVVREFLEAATFYPNKARDLAARIQFLTDNLPDLKVIIAGESTGTVITDKTMQIFKDDPRVFSIQTGTPFWHKPGELDRTLLLNSNGATIDTFSYGDIPAMVWATVKSWFGVTSPHDKAGNILFWLRAPGHDYSWQYPGVYNNIVSFIKKNFGNKS
jgi:hypothetical protein